MPGSNYVRCFRLTSIGEAAELDAYLEGRGYARIDETRVLTTTLRDTVCEPGFKELPMGEWLDYYSSLSETSDAARKLHGLILSGIQTDCAFATMEDADGNPRACGLAVAEQGLVGLFDIFTDPAHRRAGYGQRLVRSLLSWGADRGAQLAYLQMMADNAPAASMYEKLGFSPLYTYWYRTSP